MATKPALPFSDPSLRLQNRVGIVNHATCGDTQIIWFSKPVVLISLLAAGILLLLGLSCLTYFASASREKLGVIGLVYLPVGLFLGYLIHSLARPAPHLELSDGKVRHLARSGATDTLLQEVAATSVHSVSSEAATASPRTSMDHRVLVSPPPYALFPSILICADPTNITLRGPRRFQYKEVELITSILNRFRHSKP